MIAMTLGALADAAGGRLENGEGEAAVPGPFVSDHRQVVPGAVFVAIAGERVDGHEYAAQALAAGAVAVVAARPLAGPCIVVDDPVAALGRVARHVLARLPQARVVGVTGSSGKTSTKDLLGQVLTGFAPTVAPAGSLNTEVGLPITVLTADESTRYLALEYSARGIGHIAYLCDIARPDVAVVLNVGSAHLGEFGSREAVAAAKGELVAALTAEGTAVLNADDPLVAAMASRCAGRVLTFGTGEQADVRATDVELDELARPRFTVRTAEGTAAVSLQVHGAHHVSNALAVIGAGTALGLDLAALATALSGARALSRWRMEVAARPDGVTVINDAYNANPESMRAGLQALAALAHGRRTWAVLGPMAELGEDADAEHDALGRLVVRLGISKLVAVGPGAARLHAGAALEGSWSEESVLVADADAAVALLREQLRPGDVVLVKASRSAGLERVADALLADGATGAAEGVGA